MALLFGSVTVTPEKGMTGASDVVLESRVPVMVGSAISFTFSRRLAAAHASLSRPG